MNSCKLYDLLSSLARDGQINIEEALTISACVRHCAHNLGEHDKLYLTAQFGTVVIETANKLIERYPV